MAEKSTIARPYAQAVYQLATKHAALAQWSDMLALVAAIVSDPDMQRLISNPRVDKATLVSLIKDVCGDKLDETGLNMLQVLAENHRLTLLPEILVQFEIYRAEAEKTVQAQVIAAYPVSDQQQLSIVAALKKRLGREVTLECRVDESLLGGAIIRAGDIVIDGSVTGHLGRLAHSLSQ